MVVRVNGCGEGVKHALVTGATGFCGRYLCRYLQRKGYAVTGGHYGDTGTPSMPGISLIPLDVRDPQKITELIRKQKPDFIFHLAAMSVPRFSWTQEIETFAINTAGTIYLLEAMRRFVPKARMLFASTVQVYGRTFRKGKPVRETDLLWPESPYAASKAAAELACYDYYARFGIEVIVARPFNHIGAGQADHFVISDWCRQVAMAEKGQKEPVLEVGNLGVWRDFLHVQDVVRAYDVLMRKGRPGRVYNIALGKSVLLKDYVRFLVKSARKPLKVVPRTQRMRRGDPPVMCGNTSLLRAIGWKPGRTPFEAIGELLGEWREKVVAHA
ncbi:MAG: GDP-mannose 4,6-dehydratase [Candidatus Omnitrophica bacterium]|nr:GDP-mannose 4,6-dehydratase [Candidatus Omnitrophota bacterium]